METKEHLTRNQLAARMLEQIELDTYFSYEILQHKHISRVISMFTKTFCDREPMTRYIEMEYESFLPFATAVTVKAAEEGLSIVALEGDRVVACTLVEDFSNPLPLNFPVAEKFGPIFSVLEELSKEYFAKRKVYPNEIAHLFITAVDEDYHYRGLSKQVNFRAMAVAASRGFKQMVSELTNEFNERGIIPYLRYNKWELGRIVYNEYIFQGNKVFANLSGSGAAWLWDLVSR